MCSLSPAFTQTRTSRSFPLLVGAIALTLYLGFSPVYWLPGVSIQFVRIAKLLLAAAAVFSVYSHGLINGSLRFPTGILGPVGFLIMVVLAMPGMLQADFSDAVSRLIDFVLSFGFLWCFYNYVREGGNWQNVFKGAGIIVAILATVSLANAFTGLPNWSAPFGQNRLPLFITGFGAKRTGWSIGIALFVPIAFLYASESRSRFARTSGFVRVAMVIVLILGAQIACGGRAGIIASIVAVLVNAWQSSLKWHFVARLVLVAISAYYSADFLMEQLRLGPVVGSGVTFGDLDRLSSGRISGYVVALELIKEKPFLGHGFQQIALEQYGMQYSDVHNLWLQLWVESGLALPVAFAVFAITICVHTLRRGFSRIGGIINVRLTLILIVIGGLLISMFEPRTLIGSFQNTAIWWAAAGVLLGESVSSASGRVSNNKTIV